MKRHRGRGRRSNGNTYSNPNRHFESVGPGVKIRGSAQQVLDKYQQYARDALTSGDRVLAEALFQYAEHYQRIVSLQTASREKAQKERDEKNQDREPAKRTEKSNDKDTPIEVKDTPATDTVVEAGSDAAAKPEPTEPTDAVVEPVETVKKEPVKRTRRRRTKVTKVEEGDRKAELDTGKLDTGKIDSDKIDSGKKASTETPTPAADSVPDTPKTTTEIEPSVA